MEKNSRSMFVRCNSLYGDCRASDDGTLPLQALPAPVGCGVLHCRCRAEGALVFETEQPATYQDVGDSGLPVLRRFCPKCGSPIVTEVAAMPTMDFLKAGTLDDTSWLKPELNIWCDSAQPWVKLDESIPCVPGNPPSA